MKFLARRQRQLELCSDVIPSQTLMLVSLVARLLVEAAFVVADCSDTGDVKLRDDVSFYSGACTG